MKEIKKKPFNLEEAKKGAAVCDYSGNLVRILCFDAPDDSPIIALVQVPMSNKWYPRQYDLNGQDVKARYDIFSLYMLEKGEITEKYVNLFKFPILGYKLGKSLFDSEEEARKVGYSYGDRYIKTIKIDCSEPRK